MANKNIVEGNDEAQGRDSKSQARALEFGALSETLLGHIGPQFESPVKMRRESFTTDHTSAFSPSETAWPGFHFSIENNNMDNTAPQQSLYPPHQSNTATLSTQQSGSAMTQVQWQTSRLSGSCTPTPGFEHMTDYVGHRPSNINQQPLQPSQHMSFEGLNSSSSSNYFPQPFPASPTSTGGGWMSASPSEAVDLCNAAPGTDANSPTLTGTTHVLRRDGIRKKNARFEIPAERNLRTIDQLINQTSDEQEIKELKQQKRLLRNRQAALDSRQRKKQHTERLEEEKKHYTSMISDLEEALADTRIRENEWAREKENYVSLQQQYQRYIDNVTMEKEEMIRHHTIETGELRKKNALLVEHLQRLDGATMSAAPSSTGFSTDFSDFDHLTMNSWDDFSMAHDFSIENEHRTNILSHEPGKEDTARGGKSRPFEDGTAVPAGFLLMLLLCGAWVASKGPSTASDLLPAIPNDVRNASATMLDVIYKDSGVSMQAVAHPSLLPLPQTDKVTPCTAKSGTFSPYEYNSVPRSPLEAMHQHLTAPSEQQVREQAFSLNSNQYNDLSTGIDPYKPASESQSTRTLNEILSSTRVPNERVAETYTRSLMKDRVSTQVLRDFARMVAQSDSYSHDHSQWKPEPLD